MACRLPVAASVRAARPAVGDRAFHASAVAPKPRRQRNRNNPFALNQMKHFQYDDIPTFGHVKLQKQRQMLDYYRLLQHEVPQLAQFREPFTPAPASDVLTFELTHYQGEAHPGARKAVLHAEVRELFRASQLTAPAAQIKFLLLAGARWRPANVQVVEALNAARAQGTEALQRALDTPDLGTLKISCADYPHETQNMKWCSDVLDRMLSEAQATPTFDDVPLDVRPYIKSEARGGRLPMARAADFPKEWL
ncbi:37S ribosomal protein S24, mitochondrial [Malassezia brasiliensis]|uniref:37S ribosomal protein S24, mitochondrial n=1 Tax=Malassezia brasiliensis TaxID=1821822 RepID=A0AAF0ILU6_9BASI|nr:37S ribosomal protein S24, mitochondrial [Malassezia brasiliensis]